MVRSRGWAAVAAAFVLSVASACGGGPAAPQPGHLPTSSPPTTPASTPSTAAGSAPAKPVAGVGCPSNAKGGRQAHFGQDLGGLVFGTGRTGVVLSHQSDGDLCQWLPYGKELAQRGYRVLAFDFPGTGASTDSKAALDDAVVAAAAFLRSDGATKVVLIGASMGGTASIAAAVKIRPPVAGVISLSGPGVFQDTRAIDAAPELAVPVLYVAAEDDPTFANAAHELYDATPTRVSRKLVMLPSGGHGVQLLDADLGAPAGPEVTKFLSAVAPPS